MSSVTDVERVFQSDFEEAATLLALQDEHAAATRFFALSCEAAARQDATHVARCAKKITQLGLFEYLNLEEQRHFQAHMLVTKLHFDLQMASEKLRMLQEQPISTPPSEDDFETSEDDFETSLEKAQNGDAEAQFRVAICYALGRGVDRSEKIAGKFYRLSAAQGHAISIDHIAKCEKFGLISPEEKKL